MTGAALGSRPASAAALRVLGDVGADRWLTLDEVDTPHGLDGSAVRTLWRLYDGQWRRFCGARIDPQFNHIDHPARRTGGVLAPDGAPTVVVGTGPSLTGLLPILARLRSRLHLVTSPRGADALAAAGLVPDLVVIEHATALDAHFTASDRRHRASPMCGAAAWVAAEPKTPPALLAGVPADRLFVPDPWPGWGLWPATAVALALASGSRTIVLAGIDLGRPGEPAAEHAPLRDVLSWLSAHGGARCVDAGIGGAAKAGWPSSTLDEHCPVARVRRLEFVRRPWLSRPERAAAAEACLQRSLPAVGLAREALQAALRVRATGSMADVPTCERGLASLLALGGAPDERVLLQDGLGVSFLPRLWRTPPDERPGLGLWRAAALAADEIIEQHRALGDALDRAARA